MKNNLEQKISKLVFQIGHVTAGDGIGDLVGFLDGIGSNAGKILFDIPGTTVFRVTQFFHDFEQLLHGISLSERLERNTYTSAAQTTLFNCYFTVVSTYNFQHDGQAKAVALDTLVTTHTTLQQ